MTYRELLELYKKKELDEEKMHEIQEDIEKQDAISEYLFEEMEDLEFKKSAEDESGRDENSTSEDNFVSTIQKSIRRAFTKMGIAIIAVTLIFVLLTQTILPKVIAWPYYNPEGKKDGFENQLSLDMMVYTELCMPQNERGEAIVRNEGYGNYTFMLPGNIQLNEYQSNEILGTIRKGKLTIYGQNTLKPLDGVFGWRDFSLDEETSLTDAIKKEEEYFAKDGVEFSEDFGPVMHTIAGKRESSTQYLKELSDKENYKCFVSLDKKMTYDEFWKWLDENDIYASWCAVQTDSDGLYTSYGFNCDMIQEQDNKWYSQKYPNLVSCNPISGDNLTDEHVKDSEYMKKHFTSMLRYLGDQKGFSKMMEDSNEFLQTSFSFENFKEMANYVDKNGLNIYGFMMYGDKETALRVNDVKGVYQVVTISNKE